MVPMAGYDYTLPQKVQDGHVKANVLHSLQAEANAWQLPGGIGS